MEWTAGFARATETQWRAAVDRVLKGADFDRVLVGRTMDGIAIQPLGVHAPDATTVTARRGAGRWGIAARMDDPDSARANAQVLEDLDGGADTLVLAFAGARGARGFGLRDHAPATLATALAGVHLDLVDIRLEAAPFGGRATAEGFAAHARRQRLPGATLRVDFGLQPIADLALTGRTPLPFDAAMNNVLEVIRHVQGEGFSGPFLRCDGRVFHESGASEAQELAAVIAQGATYLRELARRGVAPEEAADWLSFTLAADDDQFLTIAKFRALRLLWARIEEICGVCAGTPGRPIRLHGETAWRMLTRRDPYVNLLRATIAAFSAGVGSADSIDVLPFTAALGLADGAARRLARNTSLILMAESNVHRMIDPAGGAGGIEALTEALCEKAWGLFQHLERQRDGQEAGIPAALSNGFLAEMIRDTRDSVSRDLATRKRPVTGVSEFPDIREAPAEVLLPALPASPDAPFPSIRLSEPFEALRDKADALAAGSNGPPRVFLANLGRVADFTARATFAKNAFEAGGIEAITNNGFAEAAGTDLVALTEAFKASGARLACIASSDACYAEEAVDAAIALNASGARGVYLAGVPGERTADLMAAGISGFVFARCDLLAFLADALRCHEGEDRA